MNNSREKTLIIVTLCLLGFMVLMNFVIDPALAWRTDLIDQKSDLVLEMADVSALIEERNLNDMDKRWSDMIGSGGLNIGRGQAEGRVYRSVQDWADETGVKLETINPLPIRTEGEFPQIPFRVTLSGRIRPVITFFQLMEQANFPIRVHDMQISDRKEGQGELAITLQFSTLYLAEKKTTVSRNENVAMHEPGSF